MNSGLFLTSIALCCMLLASCSDADPITYAYDYPTGTTSNASIINSSSTAPPDLSKFTEVSYVSVDAVSAREYHRNYSIVIKNRGSVDFCITSYKDTLFAKSYEVSSAELSELDMLVNGIGFTSTLSENELVGLSSERMQILNEEDALLDLIWNQGSTIGMTTLVDFMKSFVPNLEELVESTR